MAKVQCHRRTQGSTVFYCDEEKCGNWVPGSKCCADNTPLWLPDVVLELIEEFGGEILNIALKLWEGGYLENHRR